MGNMVSNFPRLTCFEQKDGIPGVVLTGQLKRIYQVNMVDALFDGSLRFERDFFTVSKKKGEHVDPDVMIALLRDQMERFHWEHKPASDAHGKDRWAMTGKLGEKQDDALLALLMAYTWGNSIQTNLRYRTLLQSAGGMRRGVVQEISRAVMKSFQTIKNTSIPTDLEHKLAAMTNKVATDQDGTDVSAWQHELQRGNRRLRGGPNKAIDMTSDKRVAPTQAAKRARQADVTAGGLLAEKRRRTSLSANRAIQANVFEGAPKRQ